MRIDEIRMDWDEFESLIHSVWESSSAKLKIHTGFRILVGNNSNDADGGGRKQLEMADKAQNTRGNETIDGLKDVEFDCVKCKGHVSDKWTENGSCPFDSGCRILHPELTEESKKDLEGPKKFQYACRFYRMGSCKMGAEC